ncbi:MAG: hypothetical protein Q7T70_09895 [Polaromonas sp.]|nr:hypothetical protein [Polaromonas sp.]
MHNAPPVVYPLGRSRFQAAVFLACWLTGAAVFVVWWLHAPQRDWRLWLGLAAVLTAGVIALAGWGNSPTGQLHWDGQTWRWQGLTDLEPQALRRLAATLDLQGVLLLRIEIAGRRALWLWAGRVAMPERWLDLRRAVYSRRKASPAPLLFNSLTPVVPAERHSGPRPPRPHP